MKLFGGFLPMFSYPYLGRLSQASGCKIKNGVQHPISRASTLRAWLVLATFQAAVSGFPWPIFLGNGKLTGNATSTLR